MSAKSETGLGILFSDLALYESYTQVYAFWLLTLRFRKNNGRSNTAEIRRL